MEEIRYYSVDEAAAALRVSAERVQQMLRDGELQGIPPDESGRGWRIRVRVRPDQPASVPPPHEEFHQSRPIEPEAATRSEEAPEGAPEPAVEQAAAADTPRGDHVANAREPTSPSGWVTTQQAARALGISPRTVRWHIEQGNLEAKLEGGGVRRTWLVSIDSLHMFRDARQAAGGLPDTYRAATEGADIVAQGLGNPIRELADRLAEEAARAAEYRVRLELTERAESTVRAELEETRRRMEEAERERDELRRQLEALRRAREVPQTSTEAPERGDPPAPGGPQTGYERAPDTSEYPVRRRWPLWRRVFERTRRGFSQR
jgi:excisionase family DNA binding protein